MNPTTNSLFGPQSGAEQPKSDLIPDGTLSFAVISMSDKGFTYSQKTGGRMANMVATLYGNPAVQKRKIFFYLADIFDEQNGADFKRMTISAITRIGEASGVFDPANPESYKKLEGISFEEIIEIVSGLDAAIEISLKKGTGGHADKNDIKSWLTPSTEKSSMRGKSLWDMLISGVFTSVQPRTAAVNAAKGQVAGGPKVMGPAAKAAAALAGKVGGAHAGAGAIPTPAGVSALKRPGGPGMFGGGGLPKPPAAEAPAPTTETATGDVTLAGDAPKAGGPF